MNSPQLLFVSFIYRFFCVVSAYSKDNIVKVFLCCVSTITIIINSGFCQSFGLRSVSLSTMMRIISVFFNLLNLIHSIHAMQQCVLAYVNSTSSSAYISSAEFSAIFWNNTQRKIHKAMTAWFCYGIFFYIFFTVFKIDSILLIWLYSNIIGKYFRFLIRIFSNEFRCKISFILNRNYLFTNKCCIWQPLRKFNVSSTFSFPASKLNEEWMNSNKVTTTAVNEALFNYHGVIKSQLSSIIYTLLHSCVHSHNKNHYKCFHLSALNRFFE